MLSESTTPKTDFKALYLQQLRIAADAIPRRGPWPLIKYSPSGVERCFHCNVKILTGAEVHTPHYKNCLGLMVADRIREAAFVESTGADLTFYHELLVEAAQAAGPWPLRRVTQGGAKRCFYCNVIVPYSDADVHLDGCPGWSMWIHLDMLKSFKKQRDADGHD